MAARVPLRSPLTRSRTTRESKRAACGPTPPLSRRLREFGLDLVHQRVGQSFRAQICEALSRRLLPSLAAIGRLASVLDVECARFFVLAQEHQASRAHE